MVVQRPQSGMVQGGTQRFMYFGTDCAIGAPWGFEHVISRPIEYHDQEPYLKVVFCAMPFISCHFWGGTACLAPLVPRHRATIAWGRRGGGRRFYTLGGGVGRLQKGGRVTIGLWHGTPATPRQMLIRQMWVDCMITPPPLARDPYCLYLYPGMTTCPSLPFIPSLLQLSGRSDQA